MNSDNLMINATEAIRKDIIYGEYELGEPLSEIKICKKYHLSKTPVREALAILQNEGLVNRIARRGSFVFDITVSEIKQIAESRYLLENYAIQNSMIASPQILVNKLTEIYENMVKAAHLNDHVAFLDLDTEFHKSFFISCNNDYLVNFYNVLSNKSQALKYYVVKNAIEGGGGLISHKSILDDVKNNNIDALSENLKQHLTEWINKYILNTKLNSSY
jgi:DNA-binding GntR family transcriptional regulator